jgi:hypothetical protein
MLEQESFMQRINIAALGITLALTTTAVSAASFDATRGTYGDGTSAQPPQAEAPQVQPMATISQEAQPMATISQEAQPMPPINQDVQPMAPITQDAQPMETISQEAEPLATIPEERVSSPMTREELAPERRALAINEAPAYAPPQYDPRHPHTGHLIDRGLFNRTGPNDFGA